MSCAGRDKTKGRILGKDYPNLIGIGNRSEAKKTIESAEISTILYIFIKLIILSPTL